MMDPRVTRLAELLADHSCELSDADTVLVHAFDTPSEVIAEVVRVAQSRGAKVITRIEDLLVKRQVLLGLDPDYVNLIADLESYEMKKMTAYISLRGSTNIFQSSDVPSEKMRLWSQGYVQPVVLGLRVPNTKWVGLRWPNAGMAQQASMSTPAFEDFYFKATTMDYAKMAEAVKPLQDLMDRTDRVKITGRNTEFTFSIKGIGSVPCTGERNIPDGECFSAPVRESINGVIQFNTSSLYEGVEFKDIRFEIKDGKIVDATSANNTQRLNEVLDTDAGARYFGEWSLGFNPYVLHPMKDTLFDEKIAGSFHFTPGNAYEGTGGNGNQSAVHWDLVFIQRPEYGGGEIYFDDVLVRKDGLFVLEELAGLNPENLG